MPGSFHYFLIWTLAYPLRSRLRILQGWKEPFRYAASVAIVQYAVASMDFLAYFVFGMGNIAFYSTTAILVILNVHFWSKTGETTNEWSKKDLGVFIPFLILFCVPFFFGLSVQKNGEVHFLFNF